MLSSIVNHLFVGAGLLASALAVTPVSNDEMTRLVNEGGAGLALKAQPMWFFGQSQNRPPCIPTWATTNGGQTPSAALCNFPNMGCNCRTPGVGIGNPTPAFPVYYSVRTCDPNMIRVQYSVFYEKDGSNPEGVGGHRYDWERVVVEWRRGANGSWVQYRLHLSQHSGYQALGWPDIQNTFSDSDAGAPRGGDNGRKNLDHAKVYVGWAKHAHYNTRNTGWNDPLSQHTGNAFRSQDWWGMASRENLIRADGSTQIGQQLASYNWGSASSQPAGVHDGLCSI